MSRFGNHVPSPLTLGTMNGDLLYTVVMSCGHRRHVRSAPVDRMYCVSCRRPQEVVKHTDKRTAR